MKIQYYMKQLRNILEYFKRNIIFIIIKCFYHEMPFCVYPIFRKGKADYDSWMIKGYSYALLIPNKGTKNIIHLKWNDFAMHEEDFIDKEEGIFKIEDTEQPFFEKWIDAYNAALNVLKTNSIEMDDM